MTGRKRITVPLDKEILGTLWKFARIVEDHETVTVDEYLAAEWFLQNCEMELDA